MLTYIITFLLTLVLFIGAAMIINFSRRRLTKTRHGLSGMCHKNGSEMCRSCAESLNKKEHSRS